MTSRATGKELKIQQNENTFEMKGRPTEKGKDENTP